MLVKTKQDDFINQHPKTWVDKLFIIKENNPYMIWDGFYRRTFAKQVFRVVKIKPIVNGYEISLEDAFPRDFGAGKFVFPSRVFRKVCKLATTENIEAAKAIHRDARLVFFGKFNIPKEEYEQFGKLIETDRGPREREYYHVMCGKHKIYYDARSWCRKCWGDIRTTSWLTNMNQHPKKWEHKLFVPVEQKLVSVQPYPESLYIVTMVFKINNGYEIRIRDHYSDPKAKDYQCHSRRFRKLFKPATPEDIKAAEAWRKEINTTPTRRYGFSSWEGVFGQA